MSSIYIGVRVLQSLALKFKACPEGRKLFFFFLNKKLPFHKIQRTPMKAQAEHKFYGVNLFNTWE